MSIDSDMTMLRMAARVDPVLRDALSRVDAEIARLREQADALAAALAEVFRETEHINTRRGSRNGRIREVAEAALRAYREGTK